MFFKYIHQHNKVVCFYLSFLLICLDKKELQKSLESSNIDRKEMAAIFAEQKKQFSSGIPECGSDALRMALCSYDFKGTLYFTISQYLKMSEFFI